MKNINIIFKLAIIALTIQQTINAGFAGRAAQQASEANQAAVRQGLTETLGAPAASSSTQCCGAGNSCQPTPTSGYIPGFTVNILSSLTGTPNTSIQMLGTNNTNFNSSTNLLTVHIFPPSNIISGSQVTTPNDDNYLISCTLKDFTGNNIYKEFATYKSTTFPYYINITGPTTAPASTATNPAYFTPFSSQNYPNLPNSVCIGTMFPPKTMSKMSTIDQQKVINGMTPLVQNFLFITNESAITVTHLSGAFGTETSSSLKLGSTSSFSPAKASVGSDAILPLNISFNDTGTPTSDSILLTFDLDDTTPKIPFTSADLAAGLILDVVVFPSSSGNNYTVIGTIKTLDGTKLRKKYTLPSSSTSNPSAIGSLPTAISLSQGDPSNPTLILYSDILSSTATNSTYFNFISPLNLKFIISQPTGSKTLQALMI